MKDDDLYLIHMLETARRIERRMTRLSRSEFDQNEDVQLALVHLLQTVGEAARKVSDKTRALRPEIPWTQAVGMRHRLVHDYIRIDLEIVWNTAVHNIPPLIKVLQPIVDPIIAAAKAQEGTTSP
ncbi:MAG: HepT-like ribonuclease domain-containing protein [Tepidisphaeraceae bacterium]